MKHELVNSLKQGCTVWDMGVAKKIRELKQNHPDWITIIDDMKELESILGVELDVTKKIPYFGAILTKEGTKNIVALLTL